ncbi:MAG: PilW family protein [Burkholderiales bacterium]|nr:PilW family protein [Burkholderiales bacterium]MDE1928350.1 PilW family protein [Burkholderiales bacterium]MDE2157766.1 PilW family protein [Burkholderiales bacterium]MDE2502160.1 PilW family protein [Burkholderiales bacterium]
MTRRQRQRGLTLVELVVALTVGLFVVAGYALIVVNTHSSIRGQGELRDWQDAERMAFSTISDIVGIAGYYPLTTIGSLGAAFPTGATNLLAGTFGGAEFVSGVDGAGTASDSFALRFVQDPTNASSVIATTDCNGNPITAAAAAAVTNMFTVNGNGQLTCTSTFAPNPQPLVLVSGVQTMKVLYGIDVNATGSVSRYMTATQVTAAAAWSQVRSLQVTLTFVNPLAGNAGQPATLSMSRVIGIQGSA